LATFGNFIVKGTLIRGRAPSWSSSRWLCATFRPSCYYWSISCNRTNIFPFFYIICTYCLIQIILNVNLSTKVRRYLKSGKYREKFVEVIIFHKTFSATDSAEFCPDKLIICWKQNY